MSIPLTINGAVFEYPVDFDENWGVDATGWAQAVTNGMLQMAGGSFPITADVNFGPNFGLLSKYFETRSSFPATTGTIRLSPIDAGIAWRNNAHSGNNILTTDASDNLQYNGSTISGGVNAGTQFKLAYYAITSSNVSPNPNTTAATQALVTDANGVPTTTGNGGTTATEISYVNGVTSAIQTQLNAKATDTLVVHLAGMETITGTKTFGATQTFFADGAAATPSISFTSDTNTGIFWPIADALNLVTGGVTQLSMTTTSISSALPIAMNAQKITGLANGTAATDAAAFGQIKYLQAVQTTSTNQQTTTSSTFQAITGMSVAISPTSSSNRVKVTVSGNVRTSVTSNTAFVTIKRGSTELSGVNGFVQVVTPAAANDVVPISFSYIDSPATTSSTTYQVFFANGDNANIVEWNRNNSCLCVIMAEEIV